MNLLQTQFLITVVGILSETVEHLSLDKTQNYYTANGTVQASEAFGNVTDIFIIVNPHASLSLSYSVTQLSTST